MPKPTTMRIDPDLLDRLDDEVKRLALPSRTWLVEQIVAQWLKGQGHEITMRVTL